MGVKSPEIPEEIYEEFYTGFFGNGGFADDVFLSQGTQTKLDEIRKVDIEDSFSKFRPVISNMLSDAGVVLDHGSVDRIAMYVSFQERNGFESGVKFVHDNAHVTSKQEAARQHSVLANMKTAGV
jgi:hypothetical protein